MTGMGGEPGSGATTPKDYGDGRDLVGGRSSDIENLKRVDTMTFPEGGARAWFVAAGNGGVMFCTLGFINTFG